MVDLSKIACGILVKQSEGQVDIISFAQPNLILNKFDGNSETVTVNNVNPSITITRR